MLQLAVQQRQGEDAPVEFLLAFCRALIRQTHSSDKMSLAMRAAKAEVPISVEQEMQFSLAVATEAEKSPWPKGFFP